ncbi:hypothetical protein GBA52_026510 [Prunus armeniaca]|nr:hypothetical protein GBA52_026510 [Prunus armeniaca]
MTKSTLEAFMVKYSILPSISLRLPQLEETPRYPLDGHKLIFLDTFQQGLRLLFHPWVYMIFGVCTRTI